MENLSLRMIGFAVGVMLGSLFWAVIGYEALAFSGMFIALAIAIVALIVLAFS